MNKLRQQIKVTKRELKAAKKDIKAYDKVLDMLHQLYPGIDREVE